MRLRAVLVAIALAAGLSAPASAGQKPGSRRLGAAYAKKRAATRPTPPPPPVVIVKKSRTQSAGMTCRSTAKG